MLIFSDSGTGFLDTTAVESGSGPDTRTVHRKILDVLINGKKEQERVVANVLQRQGPVNDNSAENFRLQEISDGKDDLTLEEIVEILEALDKKGLAINPSKMGGLSPLAQKSFYEALKKQEYGTRILEDLEKIRAEVKSERGFLKTLFNIWANDKPLDRVAQSAVEFELFCQENNISYNEAAQQLTRRKTKWDKVKDYKFLIAAIGGTAAGAIGMDPSVAPVLNKVPGLFFTALPFFAVPFIGLNTFKAFSNRKLTEEAGTFMRFAGLMAVSVTIGFTASALVGDALGTLEVAPAIAEKAKEAVSAIGGGSLLTAFDNMLGDAMAWAGAHSPGKILLPAIGGAFGLSVLYKLARDKGTQAKNTLTSTFSKAAVGSGKAVHKFTDYFDKAFMGFINTAGVPAIFLLLSTTLAQGGFEKFSEYSGYYGTVGLAMAGCAATIAGASYLYGQRKEGFKELVKTFTTAFSLSSSSGTMPVTKKALEKMGVSEATRNSVVPLGATFNMMGTSLYLGMTAVCASMMLGHDPTFFEKLGVMTTAIATAFGAPGIPASSIAFMTPVLETLNMTAAQMSAVFAMILLMDRPFDMLQTGLNVTGDMVVALDTDASAKGGGIKGLLRRAFNAMPGAPYVGRKMGEGKDRVAETFPATRLGVNSSSPRISAEKESGPQKPDKPQPPPASMPR